VAVLAVGYSIYGGLFLATGAVQEALTYGSDPADAVDAPTDDTPTEEYDDGDDPFRFAPVGDALDYSYLSEDRGQMELVSNAGLYTGDYDGDGWPDLLAIGGDQPALFENRRGSFVRSGLLPTVDGQVRSAAFVDYDVDGRPDVALFRDEARPILLENVGDGFEHRATFDRELSIPLGATVADFDREGCIAHNESVLAAQLRRVRGRIRNGTLRDYVEGQARHEQWLTALFRRLDQQYGYLEERTPVVRGNEMTAATDDTLRRVEIQRFAERVTNRYRNRFDNPLVLVPCSARKPYSDSQSHGQFHDAIQYRAHLVSMTSPIGVVPQELELTYPAQHYDSVVTGRWTATETEFVASVLEAYLERNEHPRVIAHVPGEGYRDICERVEESLGLDFEYTVVDHPTAGESLSNLASTLSAELKYSKRQRQHNTVRAVADYQFGEGAGDDLFADLQVESYYPKLRACSGDGEQLAMLVPEYGVLALTIAGARRWVDSDVPTRRVEIDEFVPHGSGLAPGVVDAADDIRPGDEVVIEGPRAFAVGRARMSGPEMVESTRGVASSVRHVEEQ